MIMQVRQFLHASSMTPGTLFSMMDLEKRNAVSRGNFVRGLKMANLRLASSPTTGARAEKRLEDLFCSIVKSLGRGEAFQTRLLSNSTTCGIHHTRAHIDYSNEMNIKDIRALFPKVCARLVCVSGCPASVCLPG